jgi:hypothetical protein
VSGLIRRARLAESPAAISSISYLSVLLRGAPALISIKRPNLP